MPNEHGLAWPNWQRNQVSILCPSLDTYFFFKFILTRNWAKFSSTQLYKQTNLLSLFENSIVFPFFFLQDQWSIEQKATKKQASFEHKNQDEEVGKNMFLKDNERREMMAVVLSRVSSRWSQEPTRGIRAIRVSEQAIWNKDLHEIEFCQDYVHRLSLILAAFFCQANERGEGGQARPCVCWFEEQNEKKKVDSRDESMINSNGTTMETIVGEDRIVSCRIIEC